MAARLIGVDPVTLRWALTAKGSVWTGGAAGERLRDDPAASARGRHPDPDRQSHLPSHFRATGITAYLKNGGTLEKAAMIANHASTRTTQLYDRRNDEVSLDEVERILN